MSDQTCDMCGENVIPQQRSIYSHPDCRIKQLESENAELKRSEKELSDSFLRIRELVSAWDTKRGGVDPLEARADWEDADSIAWAVHKVVKEEIKKLKKEG